MKFSILAAILASALSFSASGATSIRCTSDAWEGATQLKFDHTFQLVDRRDYNDEYLETYFDLVPGITTLVKAIKANDSTDIAINIVIAATILKSSPGSTLQVWSPYSSAAGVNSLVLKLNSNSISNTIDYSAIPEKKLSESAQSYKERIVESLKQQEKSGLREAFVKEYGQLATVNCRKI